MKGIKSNLITKQDIDEGILGSMKLGRGEIIKQWIEDNLSNQYIVKDKPLYDYSVETNLDIILSSDEVIFKDIDIPVYFKRCYNLNLENCKMKVFNLPSNFEKIVIEDCSELQEICCNDTAYGNTLIIKNCEKLTDINLDNLHAKKVKISKCNNYTELSNMRCIEDLIAVENCKKLRTYNMNNVFSCSFDIYRCPLKYFKTRVLAHEFSLENLTKTTDIEFEVGNILDLKVTNCADLESIHLYGQNDMSAVVIDNNKNMKNIKFEMNMNYSISLCNMNNLEYVRLLPKIKGFAIFKKINIVPDVKAKKVIVK